MQGRNEMISLVRPRFDLKASLDLLDHRLELLIDPFPCEVVGLWDIIHVVVGVESHLHEII